ncbi:MAG: hypothetical protein ACQEQB_08365 [Bacteroidota bacterium]
MTAFDIIVAIIIASLLSRSITNTDLFLKVLPACLLLILMHRLFSYIASFSDIFGNLIKGHEQVLVADGENLWRVMKKKSFEQAGSYGDLKIKHQFCLFKKK